VAGRLVGGGVLDGASSPGRELCLLGEAVAGCVVGAAAVVADHRVVVGLVLLGVRGCSRGGVPALLVAGLFALTLAGVAYRGHGCGDPVGGGGGVGGDGVDGHELPVVSEPGGGPGDGGGHEGGFDSVGEFAQVVPGGPGGVD